MAKSPIDFNALIDEVTSLKGKKDDPVSVSMYIDDTAADDCIAFVRNAYVSASSNVRFSISYLINSEFAINGEDDFAVIVAGRDSRVGERASMLREEGIPVMVVTTCPGVVSKIANDNSHAIPERDIVAPEKIGFKDSKAAKVINNIPTYIDNRESAEEDDTKKSPVSKVTEVIVDEVEIFKPTGKTETNDVANSSKENNNLIETQEKERSQGVIGNIINTAVSAAGRSRVTTSSNSHATSNPFAVEVPMDEDDTVVLDDNLKDLLLRRMGCWVISACKDKSLSLSVAFPFVRKPFAENIVNVTAVQNAGVGVVMFIPGADMPIMTLNQCKMILQIAAAYGMDMTVERAFEIAAIVAGGFACRGFARQIMGVVPVLGWAVKGAVGYAGTLAMGKAAIEYFESGSGVVGVAGLGVKIAEGMQKVISTAAGQKPEEEKKTTAESVKSFAQNASKMATGAAANIAPLAQSAGKVAAESFASGIASMASSALNK